MKRSKEMKAPVRSHTNESFDHALEIINDRLMRLERTATTNPERAQELRTEVEERLDAIERRRKWLEGRTLDLQAEVDRQVRLNSELASEAAEHKEDAARLFKRTETSTSSDEKLASCNADNARLLQMLAEHAGHRYGGFLADGVDSGSISYLPRAKSSKYPSHERRELHDMAWRYTPVDDRAAGSPEDERAFWVPTRAKRALQAFADQNGQGVKQERIDEAMQEIHSVYRARERKKVQRAKEKLRGRVEEERRTAWHQTSLAQVMRAEELDRLKHRVVKLERCKRVSSTEAKRLMNEASQAVKSLQEKAQERIDEIRLEAQKRQE